MASRPVGGILSAPRGGVVIHLSGLPGTSGGQPVPVRPCSGWGLPRRPGHPGRWCALSAPFHPCLCPGGPSAVCFLWHFPAGHPDWPLASTLPYGAPTFLGPVMPDRDHPAGSPYPLSHERGPSPTNTLRPVSLPRAGCSAAKRECNSGPLGVTAKTSVMPQGPVPGPCARLGDGAVVGVVDHQEDADDQESSGHHSRSPGTEQRDHGTAVRTMATRLVRCMARWRSPGVRRSGRPSISAAAGCTWTPLACASPTHLDNSSWSRGTVLLALSAKRWHLSARTGRNLRSCAG